MENIVSIHLSGISYTAIIIWKLTVDLGNIIWVLREVFQTKRENLLLLSCFRKLFLKDFHF